MINSNNSLKMLAEFGTYRFSYIPRAKYDPSYTDPSIEMTLPAEAELSQIISCFDSFLRANGFVYEGKVEIVK